jgi:hypothetical protein
MGRKRLKLSGKRFGRLLVIREVGQNKHKAVLWECVCDCGNTIIAIGGNLRIGCTNSCGCIKNETTGNLNKTHGMAGTPTHGTWKHIIQRCTNLNSKDYKDYGGRGITVCERWLSFENFLEDMGLKPKRFSIDRIDNDRGYFKENCRWASQTIQSRNRRMLKSNKTGVTGVCWHKQSQKYRASINVDSTQRVLGAFETIGEAAKARKLGEIKYWGRKYV